MAETITPTGCCPPFDPAPWREAEVVWKDKTFVRDRVRCFMHIPIGFGKVMTRNFERIEAAGATPSELLVLADECSLWKSELYFDVTGDVPGAETETLSGTFRTDVFDGPYKDAGKWHKQLVSRLEAGGKTPDKIFAYYTTCPRCAKSYGHNYVVLLARV